jgi:hypothetical protein
VELALHVQPGARRAALIGEHGGRLKVAVPAPPLEGRANHAVLQLLAELLSLPSSALTIVAGSSARHKRVLVSSGERPGGAIAVLLLAAAGKDGRRK